MSWGKEELGFCINLFKDSKSSKNVCSYTTIVLGLYWNIYKVDWIFLFAHNSNIYSFKKQISFKIKPNIKD